MGPPQAPQGSTLLQYLELMGHQPVQHRQQQSRVVRQAGLEVLEVVAGRDGAAHRNTPRRPGAKGRLVLRNGGQHAGGEEQG